jgi:hypothetical protein
VDQKLEALVARLREENAAWRRGERRGFAETQVELSHAELDRRVRTLEDTVSDLQSRVERLESTTQ